MFVRLLLLLTVVPIAELFVLLTVHGAIAERFGFRAGLLVTVGSILLTGAVGAALARWQGLGVLRDLQRAMVEGRFPGRPLVDGALVLAGGAMLLTPGFLTDLLGLSLLVPATRAFYRRLLMARISDSIRRGRTRVVYHSDLGPGAGRPGWRQPEPPRGRVIDVTPEDQD